MKHENEEKLQDLLIGQTIDDVLFHDSHGTIIDIMLKNGNKISISTYDPQDIRDGKHFMDELCIHVNYEEL